MKTIAPTRTFSTKQISIPDLSPVSAFEKLRKGRHSFLLESVKGNEKIGRYSLIGSEPFLVFKSKGCQIEITEEGEKHYLQGDPLITLRKLLDKYRIENHDKSIPFSGAAIGYFSYDICHFFEDLPKKCIDDLNLPDCYFVFVDATVVFDHLQNDIFIISTGWPEEDPAKAHNKAEERINEIESKLRTNQQFIYKNFCKNFKTANYEIKSNFSKTDFENIVKKAKEYIAAGDIFQVNLSQRLETNINDDPFTLYQVLRKVNPSPFASFLDFDDLKIVSCSPERLIRVDGKTIETRPIAGTRPRGKTQKEDIALSAELILSKKEQAEHVMLVDLERNDLGRICKYGTVEVNEFMVIEDYSHVFHIVSNVRGDLKEGMDWCDTLRACFPGGTITGTPKIRSMEIIDELENVQRGIYTGSIGYLSFSGEIDLNIVIRTFVIKDNKAYIQVGAGIVADSDPEREYYETLYKAEALLKTLELVRKY